MGPTCTGTARSFRRRFPPTLLTVCSRIPLWLVALFGPLCFFSFLILWAFCRYYGDITVVRRHWAALQLWVDGELREAAINGTGVDGAALPVFFQCGDW